ncbi:site-specific integrase [Nocardioides soli]|uniref:Integrase n=1 Tax=Nocardioides soli TaxID=1036020 RepID=A0A7W4VXV2_9ACTN|nr:site-specific integrase [uncultured Nocardioides sp.]MBB3043334.1 integrase [Nocardioides soli]
MSGRPPMPPGTWGKISVTRTKTGTYQAEARYALFSGRVAKQRARAHSESAARTALIQKLQALKGSDVGDGELTPQRSIAELAAFWLKEKEVDNNVSANSLRAYRSVVNNQVLPAIGQRRIADCRTSVIDRVIKDRAATGADVTKLRNALHQMFGVAVRHDAIPANPVKEVARISRPRKEITYLDLEQVNQVRALIDTEMKRKRPGPRMSADLRDIVDLMLATGCRIGEAAGFIYPEIDLSSETPTLTVSGTIVTETGKGTFRQPWTKSDAGYRTLFLPPFAVDILMRRMIESPANRNGAVFTTRNGTWRQVSNWERLWNRVVDGTAYDWVTFHTFRKSVATLIDQTVDSKAAQAQLGHANEDITLEHYIHKAKVAPDLTDYLERFRPPITPKT